MNARAKKHLLKPLVMMLTAVALEGCISPTPDSIGRYTSPIGGAPVISTRAVSMASAQQLAWLKTMVVALSVIFAAAELIVWSISETSALQTGESLRANWNELE